MSHLPNTNIDPPALSEQHDVPQILKSTDVTGNAQYVTMPESQYADLQRRAQAWDAHFAKHPGCGYSSVISAKGGVGHPRQPERSKPRIKGAACTNCYLARKACDKARPCCQCVRKGYVCTARIAAPRGRNAQGITVNAGEWNILPHGGGPEQVTDGGMIGSGGGPGGDGGVAFLDTTAVPDFSQFQWPPLYVGELIAGPSAAYYPPAA